ncbi:hypothetical protein HHK36_029313 [Tetracentron sinense]|uniref:Uncharacterized protein n=1 Tax=Tetracentron sinense TaxID=13715 RepID=A0A834YEP6_TETSI|nr:hypothetical protein HHK36_029313 [Tetracentron sinense]
MVATNISANSMVQLVAVRHGKVEEVNLDDVRAVFDGIELLKNSPSSPSPSSTDLDDTNLTGDVGVDRSGRWINVYDLFFREREREEDDTPTVTGVEGDGWRLGFRDVVRAQRLEDIEVMKQMMPWRALEAMEVLIWFLGGGGFAGDLCTPKWDRCTRIRLSNGWIQDLEEELEVVSFGRDESGARPISSTTKLIQLELERDPSLFYFMNLEMLLLGRLGLLVDARLIGQFCSKNSLSPLLPFSILIDLLLPSHFGRSICFMRIDVFWGDWGSLLYAFPGGLFPSLSFPSIARNTSVFVFDLSLQHNKQDKVVEKSRETNLHTEDSEDSITMVRSMKECGFPLADEMVKEIKKSLLIMSTAQPRRG